MATHTREDVLSWRGQDLVDNDGDKIGSIEDIYLDRETDEPEWAVVTTGLFGTKRTFVPLADAQTSEDGIRVPYEKATVKDAPNIDPTASSRTSEERDLYQHYGREYSDYRGGSGCSRRHRGTVDTTRRPRRRHRHDARPAKTAAPGSDTSGPNTDKAMTRSEEELRVGTTEREAGRVRLKKYVVEDEVTETVPVRREEVRVEREPITDANVGDALDGPDDLRGGARGRAARRGGRRREARGARRSASASRRTSRPSSERSPRRCARSASTSTTTRTRR